MDKNRFLTPQDACVLPSFSQAASSPRTEEQECRSNPVSGKAPEELNPGSIERLETLVEANHPSRYDVGGLPVKIYTLGRFSAIVDKRPVELAKKPLTLLKVLIALNGRDVQEEDIAALVWPHSDGDVALQNYATTLHRLRKLFAINDLILTKNGRVSLNAEICYVDIWVFQRLVGLADSIKTRENIEITRKIDLLENAVQVYRGAFLEADGEVLACLVRMRERLRSKFARCIWELSEYYEQQCLYRQAVQVYERALEMDDATEELYRRLIMCYFRLNQRSAGCAVYQRFKKSLKETMGLAPAREMEDLYERLLNGDTPGVKPGACEGVSAELISVKPTV